MKYLTGGAILAILVGMAITTRVTNTTEYVPVLEDVKEEVIEIPEWVNDEDAVNAAKAVIERKKLEAERNTLLEEKKRLQGEIEALEAKIKELDKELGLYWQDKNNILSFIRETFPEAPHTAIAIAYAESGLRMVQSNHAYADGHRELSFGIFQIHSKAWDEEAKRIGLPNYKTDVEQNIKMARHIYETSGWSAWSVYKDGSYKLAMR